MTLLDTLVSTWLIAYQSQTEPFNGPDAVEALQSLRLDLPKRAECPGKTRMDLVVFQIREVVGMKYIVYR